MKTDYRIFFAILVGIFFGRTINPVPHILHNIVTNKIFQILTLTVLFLDVYDFDQNKILESIIMASLIIIFFEYLRLFNGRFNRKQESQVSE